MAQVSREVLREELVRAVRQELDAFAQGALRRELAAHGLQQQQRGGHPTDRPWSLVPPIANAGAAQGGGHDLGGRQASQPDDVVSLSDGGAAGEAGVTASGAPRWALPAKVSTVPAPPRAEELPQLPGAAAEETLANTSTNLAPPKPSLRHWDTGISNESPRSGAACRPSASDSEPKEDAARIATAASLLEATSNTSDNGDAAEDAWDDPFPAELRLPELRMGSSRGSRNSGLQRRSAVNGRGPRGSLCSTTSMPSTGSSVVPILAPTTAEKEEDDDSDFWSPCLGRVVGHQYFDLVITVLIILNGLSIGVQTDYMARNVTEEVPAALRGVEVFFCVAFTLELVIRIGALGPLFVMGPERVWNMFDSLVVLLQLVEELMGLVTQFSDTESSRQTTNFSFMRILRVLRLIRIVRLVRVLRLIGELRTIVTSIASSLKHLLWTVLLLILMIYTVAVYLTQLVLDHRLANQGTDLAELALCWSSMGRSCLTLYQAISGGVDWDSALTPLMSHLSILLGPMFCLYIAFALLALMNVVTGVFVENAIDSANKDKEKYLVQTAHDLFARADPHGTGVISWAEFERQLVNPELQGYFKGLGVDAVSAKGLFKILDLDNSGEIDSNELLTGTLRLRGGAKAIDLAALIYENRRMARRLQAFQRTVHKSLAKVYAKVDGGRFVEGGGSSLRPISPASPVPSSPTKAHERELG